MPKGYDLLASLGTGNARSDFSLGCSSIFPAHDLNPLASFQIFVMLEEMGDLLFFRSVTITPVQSKLQVEMAQSVKNLPEASLLAALGLYFWMGSDLYARLRPGWW